MRSSQSFLKQVSLFSVLRLTSIVCNFLSVPLIISLIGLDAFGLWALFLSTGLWLTMIDLGIGSRIKNRVATRSTQFDPSIQSDIFLYFVLIMIVVVVSLAFYWCLIFSFGDAFFYADAGEGPSIQAQGYLSVFLICLGINQVFSLAAHILSGVKKSQYLTLGPALVNCVTLVAVYLAVSLEITFGFAELVYTHSFSTLLAGCIVMWVYRSQHRNLLPKPTGLSFSSLWSVAGQSLGFFLIQLAAIFLFVTDRLIIRYFIGLDELARYEVTYRLFSIFLILHGLILMPLWPMISKAYSNSDVAWLRSTLRQNIFLVLLASVGIFSVHALSQAIFTIWLGSDYQFDPSVVLAFCFMIFLMMWANIFGTFSSATGEIQVQVKTAICAALVNVPLSIYLSTALGMGTLGVVISTCLTVAIYGVVGPFDVRRIFKNA